MGGDDAATRSAVGAGVHASDGSVLATGESRLGSANVQPLSQAVEGSTRCGAGEPDDGAAREALPARRCVGQVPCLARGLAADERQVWLATVWDADKNKLYGVDGYDSVNHAANLRSVSVHFRFVSASQIVGACRGPRSVSDDISVQLNRARSRSAYDRLAVSFVPSRIVTRYSP